MWFRRKKQSDPATTAQQLRENVLALSAADLNVSPSEARPRVWGVLMETGYPQAVATLVALADGTTSLYFSNGGGVIGAGEHETVRAASNMLLTAAEAHVAEFVPSAGTPLPSTGAVTFYLKTFEGLLHAGAREDELREGGHDLSVMFFAGHVVIAEIRKSTPGW